MLSSKEKKEKQTELINIICKRCFNNNVEDSIKITDDYCFCLRITRPNDTIKLGKLIHDLEETSVRDIRFNFFSNGIQMMFSTLSMIPTNVEKYNRIKNREKMTFASASIISISQSQDKISEVDQLWIDTTTNYMFKNLPIPVDLGIAAYHEIKNTTTPIQNNLWLQAVLNDEVTLKELKQCFELDGVKDVELSIKNASFLIKIICGLEKSNTFKQNKKFTEGIGQNVTSTKTNVSRVIREERMDKRNKHQRRNYVGDDNEDEESISSKETFMVDND